MKVIEKKGGIITFCALDNDDQFNLNKLLEEMAEFQEVMVKLKTKNENIPLKSKLIKEFGDVIYRGMIYLKQEFPSLSLGEIIERLEAHVDKKLTSLEDYRDDSLFKYRL